MVTFAVTSEDLKKKIKAVSLISNFLDLLVIMELYVNAIPVMMMSTLDTH